MGKSELVNRCVIWSRTLLRLRSERKIVTCLRLHEAQVFYDSWWPFASGSLACSSSVECSFPSAKQSVQSLHQTASFIKNEECQLGLSVNLTDWLPARATDSVHLEVRYNVLWNSPVASLMEHLDKNELVAKVSLLRPDWAAALKVSVIAGKLLSFLMGEGKKEEPFALKADLNVSNLKAGFYAVVGSNKQQVWPTTLQIADGHLFRDGGRKTIRPVTTSS